MVDGFTEGSSLIDRGGRVNDEESSSSPHHRGIKPVTVALFGFCILAMGTVMGVVFSRGEDNSFSLAEPKLVLEVPPEGKSKHNKTSKSLDLFYEEDALSYCQDGKYSKRTLKLAYELPFHSLFKDTKGQKKFEASDVIVSDDGSAYAICDSSWSISKFNTKLEPFHEGNIQVGDPAREEDESGYEALFRTSDGSFYVIRESILHEDTTYHAVIEKLVLDEDDYQVVEACSAEFEFEGDSKGFEGAIEVRDLNNELVILGLCEGNHCSESRKDDVGHGMVVAMRQDPSTCEWSTLRIIQIPSSAAFRDYSAITMDSATGKVAISSQVESRLWVGKLVGRNDAGLWDVDVMEFDQKKAKLFDFPKNDNCQTVYCNIEGVHWLDSHTIMAVSDKMKSKGRQDFRCFNKDQSVHVFVLP